MANVAMPMPAPGDAPAMDAPSKAIISLAVAALPAGVVLGIPSSWACALVAATLGGAAALTRRRLAAHTALLSAAAMAGLSVRVLGPFVPAALVLALGVTAVAGAASGPGAFAWLRRGAWSRAVTVRAVATVVIASVALVGWFLVLRPDVSHMKANLPRVGAGWLVAALIAWSCLNALAEEFVFRGVFQHALEAATGATTAVLAQGVAFGLFHFRGFPSGWSGVLLATVYGLLLGDLRRRSRGLLAPWAVHVFADLAIVAILATLA